MIVARRRGTANVKARCRRCAVRVHVVLAQLAVGQPLRTFAARGTYSYIESGGARCAVRVLSKRVKVKIAHTYIHVFSRSAGARAGPARTRRGESCQSAGACRYVVVRAVTARPLWEGGTEGYGVQSEARHVRASSW